MHTVVTDWCIGCDLCVAPCPVDCIEMIPRNTSHTLDQPATKVRLLAKKARDKRRNVGVGVPIIDPKAALQAILQRTQKKNK